MNATNKNGTTTSDSDLIVIENTKPNGDIKNHQLMEGIRSAYEQLFKEIKFNTDLTIKEILNESNLKVMKLQHEYEKKIKEIKLKQWCVNCGKEAAYYCCENTSYCSEPCQFQHWSKHFKNCLRINSNKNNDEIMD